MTCTLAWPNPWAPPPTRNPVWETVAVAAADAPAVIASARWSPGGSTAESGGRESAAPSDDSVTSRRGGLFPDYLPGMCFTIDWHAFSHRRHSSAQDFMCLSSGNFSHAAPHCPQAFV